MEPKKIFGLIFLISLILFFPLIYFMHDSYLYEAPLHLAMFSFAMFFLWRKDLKTTLKSLGIPGKTKKNLAYTILGFVLMFVILPILGAVLYYYDLYDQEIVTGIVMELPLYILAMAVVVAPISEELLFRALLITKIRKYVPTIIAVIIAAAIFALFHVGYGSVVQLIGVFTVGLILGFVYWRSGSILPSMFIHLAYNLMSIMVMRGFI